MARKAISKRVRFEVFKRDSFKCQYCGKSSPEVILHIDHIKPVSKGGDNSMVNLVTACDSCNLGKSDVEIGDDAAVKKQKQQLDELNERREQLKMMMEWRDSMKSLDDEMVDIVVKEIVQYTDRLSVNDNGRAKIKAWLKKFSMDEILDSIDDAYSRRFMDKDMNDSDTFEAFFRSIPKAAAFQKLPEKEQKVLYIKGILRNRVFLNDRTYHTLMNEALKLSVNLDQVQELAKTVKNWTEFCTTVENFIEAYSND